MQIKNVEALTIVGISDFSFKYSSKTVQFSVCCLKYGVNYKTALFYQCLENNSTFDATATIISESFKWLYGSFKQSSVNINHSYWLQSDIKQVVAHGKAISKAINTFGSSNFTGHVLNLNQYIPDEKHADIKTIFALEDLIPLLIVFNDKGVIELKLKDCAIDLLLKRSFFITN